MIIDPRRIEHGLKDAGFRLSYFSAASASAFFARRVGPSLFEGVTIDRATQRQDTGQLMDLVGASVDCCVVPGWTALKGLAIAEFLRLPSCNQEGWAQIAGEEDAARWLGELAAAAPSAVRAARQRHGETLLANTAGIRGAAEGYFRKLPAGQSIEECIAMLRSQATEPQIADAAAWCKQRVIVIPDGGACYEAAALAIAIFQDQVEHQPDRFTGKRADDPEDRGLMLRLQVLASHLAREPGWDWPIAS